MMRLSYDQRVHAVPVDPWRHVDPYFLTAYAGKPKFDHRIHADLIPTMPTTQEIIQRVLARRR